MHLGGPGTSVTFCAQLRGKKRQPSVFPMVRILDSANFRGGILKNLMYLFSQVFATVRIVDSANFRLWYTQDELVLLGGK